MPYDHNDWEPVGKSMEYFLADWAGAEALGRLGMKEDSAHFHQRSMGYKKMFDKQLQFFRALDDKGEFRSREGFNPCHQTSDYTEGNPWQYAWLVPHDVPGLVECFGGKENFIFRLDSLFLASSELNAEANPDITGLIGQYAHGNEPSHHIIYLYNYVGQPWKTARRVRQVMNELYTRTLRKRGCWSNVGLVYPLIPWSLSGGAMWRKVADRKCDSEGCDTASWRWKDLPNHHAQEFRQEHLCAESVAQWHTCEPHMD